MPCRIFLLCRAYSYLRSIKMSLPCLTELHPNSSCFTLSRRNTVPARDTDLCGNSVHLRLFLFAGAGDEDALPCRIECTYHYVQNVLTVMCRMYLNQSINLSAKQEQNALHHPIRTPRSLSSTRFHHHYEVVFSVTVAPTSSEQLTR